MLEGANTRYEVQRNAAFEKSAQATLAAHGLKPWPASITGYPLAFGSMRQLKSENPDKASNDSMYWARFQDEVIPKLKKLGWQVTIDKMSKLTIMEDPSILAEFGDSGDNDATFRFSAGVEIDGERYSLFPLFKMLLKEYGQKDLKELLGAEKDYEYIPVDDNKVIKMPIDRARTLIYMLSESIKHFVQESDDALMPIRLASDIGLLDETLGETIQWQKSGKIQKVIEIFNGFAEPPNVKIPSTIETTLDQYQVDGVRKMCFLADHGFTPMLFDQMGLGKTLQLLAFYAVQKQKNPRIGPVLVVVMTAGVNQWKEQVQRHYPSMRVGTIGGGVEGATAKRPKERKAVWEAAGDGEYDLVACVYESAYNDHEAIKAVQWYAVFTDEAQYINGASGKIRERLSDISGFRIPATGTPLENRLDELWAITNYANPGYLGSKGWFNRNIGTPISSKQSESALRILKTKLAPLCRRKKRNDPDVNLKIPEPNIQVVEMTLTGAQQDLYESVNVVLQKKAREAIKELGVRRAGAMVLRALLGVRQIVCNPAIYKARSHDVTESCKTDALEVLLDEFRSTGKQALVFSTFEMLMPHFQTSAKRCGVASTVVTGKVTNRQTEIDSFRAGDSQVLFATLQTMNASVDLYEAKALVLYEPWWNPHKEDQGIGRMVRRGQEDETTVYRLIAPDTVERHLLAKQNEKLALLDAVFEGNSDAFAQELTEEDIRALLVMD